MQRQPEPELMDAADQARAYAEADFSEPHQRFIELFRARWPHTTVRGRVLDLGCGPADVTCRFASAFPDCAIDGLDGAAKMLAHGHARLHQAGLSHRITLHRAHLPLAMPIGRDYDIVISTSLLHHLNDPLTLWQTIRQHGRSGAFVCVMDLLRPASEYAARVLVGSYAADAPEILRHDFYCSLLAAYRPDEVHAQLAATQLGQLQVEIISDRHWLAVGTLP